MPGRSAAARGVGVHWLLPIDPAAHLASTAQWRDAPDAVPVWAAIGRSQPIDRWCLSSGYRVMRPGDLIWAYLSRRQELCAVGTVQDVVQKGDSWFVLIDWDAARTESLCRNPVPRSEFGQVPMSTCRARPEVAAILAARYDGAAYGRAHV